MNVNMDIQSLASSDFSESISNDTFEITRRARQDMIMDSRVEAPRLLRQFGTATGTSTELSFPLLAANDAAIVSLPSSPSHSMKRRVVNFSGMKVINEGPEGSISEEEMQVRWWTQDDLDEIKQAAKEMSIRLRRMAKEKGCYVETAHKKTTLMLNGNFQELVKMTPTSPDQDLRHWCARSDGRRGLERFASREYGNMRKDDVINARDAVFREQERQRQKQMNCPEMLAKVSKEKSRRARTFSLFMGEADAQAATRVPSAKRAKVASSSQQQQQQPQRVSHKQQRQQIAVAEVRNFAVESPMLKLAA